MTDDRLNAILIGSSPAMARVRALIRKVAPTELAVLIDGPTGAGKELVAQALHAASGRTGRLVAFNVCAIPDAMFEDALFGHVRGAFTGAMNDSPGYLAEADKGTTFFDEIGGLPVGSQAKLLRVLETREYRPVGAGADRRSDFRVISATNESLRDLLETNRLRVDLAHRLSAAIIRVPPLRDRLEDVPVLVRHFLARVRDAGVEPVVLSTGALRLLQEYDWPGNVRELKNVVERAVAMTDACEITTDVVTEVLTVAQVRVPVRDRDEFRERQLLDLLRRFAWDTDEVARELGIARTTVYRRMRRLGIRTRTWPGEETELELS